MGNVEVAWEDVISVINMMRAHLIIIAAVLIAMIVVIIAVRKMERSKRRLFRVQSVLAFLLVTVITLNIAVTGTLYNTLNVVLADKGTLDPSHEENSKRAIEAVTDEGVVMTKIMILFFQLHLKRSMYLAGHQRIRFMEGRVPEPLILQQLSVFYRDFKMPDLRQTVNCQICM